MILTEITKSYAGRRPGCMCGCLGSYSSHKSTIAKRYEKAREILRTGGAYTFDEQKNYMYIEYFAEGGGEHPRVLCFYND